MQQIRLAEALVPRACITGTSSVSLSNIGSLLIPQIKIKQARNPYFMYRSMTSEILTSKSVGHVV